jgi:hypothetical protein
MDGGAKGLLRRSSRLNETFCLDLGKLSQSITLAEQGPAIETQELGGGGLVAVREPKDFLDMTLLHRWQVERLGARRAGRPQE